MKTDKSFISYKCEHCQTTWMANITMEKCPECGKVIGNDSILGLEKLVEHTRTNGSESLDGMLIEEFIKKFFDKNKVSLEDDVQVYFDTSWQLNAVPSLYLSGVTIEGYEKEDKISLENEMKEQLKENFSAESLAITQFVIIYKK